MGGQPQRSCHNAAMPVAFAQHIEIAEKQPGTRLGAGLSRARAIAYNKGLLTKITSDPGADRVQGGLNGRAPIHRPRGGNLSIRRDTRTEVRIVVPSPVSGEGCPMFEHARMGEGASSQVRRLPPSPDRARRASGAALSHQERAQMLEGYLSRVHTKQASRRGGRAVSGEV